MQDKNSFLALSIFNKGGYMMNDIQVIHNDTTEYAPIEKMTDVSHDDDLISMWLDGLSPASRRT